MGACLVGGMLHLNALQIIQMVRKKAACILMDLLLEGKPKVHFHNSSAPGSIQGCECIERGNSDKRQRELRQGHGSNLK